VIFWRLKLNPERERPSMRIHVVNPNHEPYDIYIGRANPRRHLQQSPYANPFRIGKDETREEVIGKWLLALPELVARARYELKGKVLGYWGRPEACHGDVLAEIVDSK
jgi:hypothetical protein